MNATLPANIDADTFSVLHVLRVKCDHKWTMRTENKELDIPINVVSYPVYLLQGIGKEEHEIFTYQADISQSRQT